MPPAKKRQCIQCLSAHQGHADICRTCKRESKNLERIRRCPVCEILFVPSGRTTSSPYCSWDCGYAVTVARASIGRKVWKAIRDGVLSHPKNCWCVDCGNRAFDYDHRHYLSPLDVVPVCRSCNIKRGPAVDIHRFIIDFYGANMFQKFMSSRVRLGNQRPTVHS